MRKKIMPRLGAAFFLGGFLCLAPARVYGVVGQAEEWDPFKEADLKDFHDELVHEEEKKEMAQADEIRGLLKDKKKEVSGMDKEQKQIAEQEIKNIEKELMAFPKRDRIRFETGGQYQYDSNIKRNIIHKEKGDSVFDTTGTALFDLSGRKTDLRFEVTGAKQWNIHFPEKDFWLGEERIRTRRKYLRRIHHVLNSRVARTSSKTPEIDEKKIRWDSYQNTAFNYAFSRKLSMNVEANANKRLFTTEPFDQDSAWEVNISPSAFWNFTPKSRASLGYTYGANRIRTKSTNTDSQEVRVGYFGKITGKTSLSADISYGHQTPKAIEAPEVNTINVGTGLIWQKSAKSQWTLQLLRSVQNTTSNQVSQTNPNLVTKIDSHFTNDSISLSLNQRLGRKLTGLMTLNFSHLRTHVSNPTATQDEVDSETRQISFPLSLGLTYQMKQWLRLRLGYTFSYRMGDEKSDYYRSHNLVAGIYSIF
ncbi:MAG: outer membrane beta-barrel protein [Candidatus Omnitrophica bacterium]|nr:outer membrane beta-barrel protein [Candidatus Omnitrophota bacterium]